MGRLHTRYAPVRRSPAAYCYALLPLDLHVLGLPLAFILSQDQTLHCKNFSFSPLTRSCPRPRLCVRPPTHAISCFIRFNVLSLSPSFQPLLFPVESECKDTTVFQTTKFFFRARHKFSPTTLSSSNKKIRFFFVRPPKTEKKRPRNSLFHEKSAPFRAKTANIHASCIGSAT